MCMPNNYISGNSKYGKNILNNCTNHFNLHSTFDSRYEDESTLPGTCSTSNNDMDPNPYLNCNKVLPGIISARAEAEP